MTFETILFEIDSDNIARLTLNRPKQLNAFTGVMHDEIRAALTELETPDCPARVLLISAAGRGFCAGADIANPKDMIIVDGRPDLGASIARDYNPMMERIKALTIPVVCVVNGIAAGAGCSLALMGDLTIAAKSASFLQAFVNIGLAPDAGSSWILPRLAGPQRAMGMALLGDKLSAEQAYEWGMIWQLVEDDALAAAADKIALKLATSAPIAVARIKQLMSQSLDNDMTQQLDQERVLQRECGRTDDFRLGVTGFLMKKPVTFTGK